MTKLQDAPVVDGVCNVCGSVDEVLKALDDHLGCYAEQMRYPEGEQMRGHTPIPIEWCYNPQCPSNDISHAHRALFEFWMGRLEEHRIIKHASPMSLARLLKQMLTEYRPLRQVLIEETPDVVSRTEGLSH